MSEVSINERLRFLIAKYGLSVRAFSTAIGATDTNTRNYIDRGSKPNAEYLGKLLKRFNDINPTWLLLGEGEPFLFSSDENNQAVTGDQKFFRSPIVGTSHGPAYQENSATPATSDEENLKTKLALAEKEVEHLRAQLQSKDTVIAAKDETINALKKSNLPA